MRLLNLINFIACFETPEAKRYWINALKESDAIKGRLLYHYKLLF